MFGLVTLVSGGATAAVGPVAGIEDRRLSQSSSDATGVVVGLVYLNFLLPPTLVLPGLGAAGRPATLWSVGMLILWLAGRLVFESRHDDRSTGVRRAFYAYLLAFLASYAAGVHRGLPGVEFLSMDRRVLTVLGFAGVILLVMDGLADKTSVVRVLRALVGVGVVNAVVGLVQFTFEYDLSVYFHPPGLVANQSVVGIATRGADDLSRVRGLMRHPIEYGVVMATLLPIAVQLALSEADRRRRSWMWFAAALIYTSVFLSISRSAILGLIVGLSVIALGWSWRIRIQAAIAGLIVAIGYQIMVPGLLGTIRSLFSNFGSDPSVSGRTEDFDVAATFIAQRPWLGRGPGTWLPTEYQHLDNEYLTTVLEAGYLGLAALVALLFSALVDATWIVKHTESSSVATARGLAAGVAIAVVACATFDALGFPLYATTVMLIIGGIANLRRTEPEVARPPLGTRVSGVGTTPGAPNAVGPGPCSHGSATVRPWSGAGGD